MTIELTDLQAKKIIEALNEKHQHTSDAIWLGLRDNVEEQIASNKNKDTKPVDGVTDMLEALLLAYPYIQDLQMENYNEPRAGIFLDTKLETAYSKMRMTIKKHAKQLPNG